MEVQILRYYLKIISIVLIILSLSFSLYTFFLINKNFHFENNIIKISKNENLENVIKKNFNKLNSINYNLIKFFYKIYLKVLNKNIHYGEFYIDNKISVKNFFLIVCNPSNVLNKITIVEGWSKRKLRDELSNYFEYVNNVEYADILSDTYFFNKYESFENFIERLKKFKNDYINRYKNNIFFDNYSERDLLIIGSLIEKEGKDTLDKKKNILSNLE